MKFLTLLALLISPICQAQLSPPTLEGRYEMQLDINGTIFSDIMELKGKNQPITLSDFSGELNGSIEVPGMFISPLTGNGACSGFSQTCIFRFIIVAVEGTQSFQVIYEMQLEPTDYVKLRDGETQQVRLTGTAYLEDGSVLGTFVATK